MERRCGMRKCQFLDGKAASDYMEAAVSGMFFGGTGKRKPWVRSGKHDAHFGVSERVEISIQCLDRGRCAVNMVTEPTYLLVVNNGT